MDKLATSTYTADDIDRQKRSWMVRFFSITALIVLAVIFAQFNVVFFLPEPSNENNTLNLGLTFTHYGSIAFYTILSYIILSLLFYLIHQLIERKRVSSLSNINKLIFYKKTSKSMIRSYTVSFLFIYFYSRYNTEGALDPLNIFVITLIPIIIQVAYKKAFINKLDKKDQSMNIPEDYISE